MASGVSKEGFTCEFVDDNLEDFYCLLCLRVARDPHMISCCGEHFCKSCISPILKNKQHCPNCCAEEFTTLLNVKSQQKILCLQVYCTFKDRGCPWTGALTSLNTHIDDTVGDCEFLDITCPNKCGKKIQKNTSETHLERECLKRQYACPHCGHQDTYEAVSSKHTDQCPYFPVRCPNFCGATCERNDLEVHMNTCPLEKVQCRLGFAGCKKECQRDDIDTHMKENLAFHMTLLSEECLRMKTEFQAKLEEKEQAMKMMQTSFTRQLQMKQAQLDELANKLDNTKTSLRDIFKAQNIFYPFYFTISNFSEKNQEAMLLSDDMRTHAGGYKFKLVVHPMGVGEGAETYISLSIRPQSSLTDKSLKWPVKCSITVQLMNQLRDMDHLTATEVISWDLPISDYTLINFSRKFVRRDQLKMKFTHFIKKNTLKFRIANVTVL